MKPNLLDLTETELRKFTLDLGEKAFNGTQIFKWIHKYGVDDFQSMTNLSLKLRASLSDTCIIEAPSILEEEKSLDGTIKWLFKLSCNNNIETVFIPESNRGTLCISSQAGCALNCQFCRTAESGFNRNLTVGEIVGQLWVALKRLPKLIEANSRPITNVVFMGMGEPLLNCDNVLNSLSILLNDNAYGLSKYRVTVSTSGIIPPMLKLKEQSPASLTVSLHAPNNKLRDQLVPINVKYPIEDLLEVCKSYYSKESKRKITFAYVMLHDTNDTDQDAIQLAKLLSNIPCKVNLIPFNTYPNTIYKVCIQPFSIFIK